MRSVLHLALGLAVLLTSVRAAAGDDDATALVRRGVELRREHRNQDALAAFARALALSPTPTAKAQFALTEQALGRWVEADADLREALLGETEDAWLAKNRVSLEEARAEIARHLAWLVVDVNAPSAVADVDGRAVPFGVEARVLAGSHMLEVRAGGYAPDVRRIELGPGEHGRVAVVLVAAPAPLAPVPPDSRRPWSTPPPRVPAGALAFGAVGIAGMGIGTYFGVRALDEKRARDAQCVQGACTPAALTHDTDARRSADFATISFCAAIASFAAGAVWWFADRPTSPRRGLAVIMVPLSEKSAGLLVEGSIQ